MVNLFRNSGPKKPQGRGKPECTDAATAVQRAAQSLPAGGWSGDFWAHSCRTLCLSHHVCSTTPTFPRSRPRSAAPPRCPRGEERVYRAQAGRSPQRSGDRHAGRCGAGGGLRFLRRQRESHAPLPAAQSSQPAPSLAGADHPQPLPLCGRLGRNGDRCGKAWAGAASPWSARRGDRSRHA